MWGGGWAAEAQPFKVGGERAAPGSSHQGEKAGGNVSVYPALAQRGGPLLGGLLASLEVTRWPLGSTASLPSLMDHRGS